MSIYSPIHAADAADVAELPQFDRLERRGVEMRAFIVRSDKTIADVRVLDLSYDGCGIETLTKLAAGEVLTLSILSCGVIRAKVRWCKSRKAGLLFIREKTRRLHRDRCHDRLSVSAELHLRRSGKVGYRVKAFDLSPHGCKCEFVERPRIGEKVWVKFDKLEAIEAQICWIEGSNCGVRFSRAIHPAVFDVLVRWLLPNC